MHLYFHCIKGHQAACDLEVTLFLFLSCGHIGTHPSGHTFFKNYFYLFVFYLWLHWVFAEACGLFVAAWAFSS